MGYAYLNLSDRDNAEGLKKGIAHLKLADKEGLPRWQDRANLVMAVAEVSSMVGDKAEAAAFYDRFAKEFKRDSRNFYAREKLKVLTEKPQP